MNSTTIPLKKIFILVLSLWTSILWSQTTQDVVYLNNGSIIKGQVIEYNPNGKIKIEIAGGSILVYEAKEVQKMTKETISTPETPTTTTPTKPPVKQKLEKHMVSKGRYIMLSTGFVGAELPPAIPLPALWGEAIMGVRLTPHLSVGGGLGLQVAVAQSFLQGFGHIRLNFSKRSFSPYVDGQVGYGLLLNPNGLVNQQNTWNWMDGVQSVRTARGGWYARPAVGVRFASVSSVHCFLDVGCTFQDSYYEGTTFNQVFFIERRLQIRPSIRVGMVF